MQARLSAVQRALVLLPVASLAFAVLARPHPENRILEGALAEVSAFRAGFDQQALEKLLREHAEAQGALPLASVSEASAGKARAKLTVAGGAATIKPLSTLRLATLADAQEHGRPDSTVSIGVPEVTGLGTALAWRLNHLDKTGSLALKEVALQGGTVNEADVAAESEIAQLQTAKHVAQVAVDEATKRLEAEQNLFEARRKRGLAWKIIVQSIEARDAAKVVLTEKTQVLTDLSARYLAMVEQALRPRASAAIAEIPAFALAHVSFAEESALSPMDVPVRLEARQVSVPALRQADFGKTKEAGLWEQVKDLSPNEAVGAIQHEFNWHKQTLELAGLKLSGMTLLQLLPCALPLLMLLLRRRLKSAAASYSLFGTKIYGAMPTVGFRSRSLEGLAVVALPLLACLSAGLSLFLVGELPVLPALSALACLVLGSRIFVRVGELQGLVASVVHSHSYPPPDPRA
jgi:hypothetical protein